MLERREIGTMAGGVGILLMVLAIGCGGDSSETNRDDASGESSATQTSPPGPLDGLADQLRAAGITAEATPLLDGKAEVHVAGSEIEIGYYADRGEAAVEGRELERIAANHPKTILAGTVGPILVWVGNENGVTADQRATFSEVMKVVNTRP
jgi:hypothetical protein